MLLHRLLLALACIASCRVSAFQASPPLSQIRGKCGEDSTSAIMAVGAMGMAGTKKKKSGAEMAGKSMGMASAGTKKTKSGAGAKAQPFNVNASMMRLEKQYDALQLAASKLQKKDDDNNVRDDTSTTEYVVAARAEGYVADWVPIAQICLARTAQQVAASDGTVSDPIIRATVSYYCRELSHAAVRGSKAFQAVPRNLMQYSVETYDSFYKHVYEPSMQGKNEEANNINAMTKQEARLVLDLDASADDDKSVIKRTYRKLSFEWHPDRFVGTERTAADIEVASDRYSRIKLAYDTLTMGIRGEEGKSWYQSLGGRARTDFVGPLQLLSLDAAKAAVEASGVQTAATSLAPSLVQSFVARSSQQ